jgi:NAD(P)-dependent dehydrogenase (short-subunit alcohol dehydrogenase family)
MTGDLEGKVVLVTGASRGIGYAVALEAGRRGAHVIALARTVGGLEELDDEIQAAGSSATLVPQDLTDLEAIDRLGGAIFERWGRLDGLVGNAGVLGIISPVPHIDPKLFESTVLINLTVNFRLIRSMDPLLRLSDAGRAVFISSSSARSAKPYWGLYAATKAGLDAMVKSYAGEIRQTNAKANVAYPGKVRTRMRATAMPGEEPETVPAPSEVAPKIVDMILPSHAKSGEVFDIPSGSSREI